MSQMTSLKRSLKPQQSGYGTLEEEEKHFGENNDDNGPPALKRQRMNSYKQKHCNDDSYEHENSSNDRFEGSPGRNNEYEIGLLEKEIKKMIKGGIMSCNHVNSKVEIECKIGLLLRYNIGKNIKNRIWTMSNSERKENYYRKSDELGIVSLYSFTNQDIRNQDIDMDLRSNFYSQLPEMAFVNLNKNLNNWFGQCNEYNDKNHRSGKDISIISQCPRIKYERINQIDKIYQNKQRESIVIENGQKNIVSIKKTRNYDLNVINPQSMYDFRISSSYENDGKNENSKHNNNSNDNNKNKNSNNNNGEMQTMRCKQRIRYAFGIFAIDITKVFMCDIVAKIDSNKMSQLIDQIEKLMTREKDPNLKNVFKQWNVPFTISYEAEMEITNLDFIADAIAKQENQQMNNIKQQDPKFVTFDQIVQFFCQKCLAICQWAQTPPPRLPKK